jgi:hypothetical protein
MERPLRQHLGALAVLLFHAFMLIQAAPGFDFMNRNDYDEEDEKAEAIKSHGELVGQVVIALYAFNREYRRPVVDKLKNVERLFRIAQDWNLYRDGPSRVRRLEVSIDGELMHRSADPAYTWLNPQLRNRRLRPVLENAARKENISNWPGVMRFLVGEALKIRPDAKEVKVEATWSRFPGEEPTVHHAWLAAAPDWEPGKVAARKVEQENSKGKGRGKEKVGGTRDLMKKLRERSAGKRGDDRAGEASDDELPEDDEAMDDALEENE